MSMGKIAFFRPVVSDSDP